MPKTKKQRKRTLSAKQKKALEYHVVNGGTEADALRHAQFSSSVIRNPARVFQSSAFAQALEKAGVTDKKVAGKYSRLLNSSRIDSMYLDGWKVGRKWVYPSEKEAREMIEGSEDDPTGCDVMYIRVDSLYHRLLITYRHPDSATQARMIELVGKVKSHFAAESLGVVTHELSDEDRQFLSGLNSK